MPLFTSRTVEERPGHWYYGPCKKEKRLAGLLAAIIHLKGIGVTNDGVICAKRRLPH